MTDHETELSKLAMSQSLHQVATLAGEIKLDMSDESEFIELLNVCLVDLITALDEKRITFSDIGTKTVFFALLAGALVRGAGHRPHDATIH